MNRVVLVENRIVGGYLPGLRQPSALAVLRVNRDWLPQAPLAAVATMLAAHIPLLPPSAPRPATLEGLGQLLADIVSALMREAVPVQLQPAVLNLWDEGAWGRLQVIVPLVNLQQTAPPRVLSWLVDLLNRDEVFLHESDLAFLQRLLPALRAERTPAALALRMLEGAYANNIPWLHFFDQVYQFGWGVNARLLEGSFTDRSPAIATRLARSKYGAAYALRQAGLPVPPHRLVRNVDDALRLAEKLGWPVVVKPDDLDGGRGVAAGLNNAAALREAYARAHSLSSRILVEKHVSGKDYRLIVLHGKVLAAWERLPGAVIGDGRRSVRELLQELNADPLRRPEAMLRKRIALDNEALELLAEQQLGAEAIPAAGRSVRLRRTANIATGGSSERLASEAIHPDNILLCERAARLLRLDLAGVDLLMPDIARSWLEGGAAICEVNAQPQLAPGFHEVLLRALVAGEGRIPVALVLGDADAAQWVGQVMTELQRAGIYAGCAVGNELSSDGRVLFRDLRNATHAAQILLRDPQMQAAVICLQNVAQMENGFPVDRCDLLILAGGHQFNGEHEAIARVLDASKPRVLVAADCALWESWPADTRSEHIPSTELAARTARLLLDRVEQLRAAPGTSRER